MTSATTTLPFCSRVEVDQQGLLHEMMSSKSDVDDVTDSLQARVFDRDLNAPS